jgi:hypothetical protein
VRIAALLVAALVLGALSLLVAPAAPSYDPWAWLLWGREVAAFDLSTAEGPAFKPLPVAVCALLAPLGGAAPEAWLVVARAGALAGAVLAAVLAWQLAGGGGRQRRIGAAAAAALGVALTAGYPTLAATGTSEGLFLALALGAVLAWRAGRPDLALALGVACALLRVEAWPFLALAATARWRAQPGARPWLAAGALAVPALWFGPELLGSGDPLRSGSRALVPNPGQPALAAVPALESLRQAAALALAPLALGALLLARHGLALAGAAWVALVAAMSQVGFSGEPRYALPGVALIAVVGAAGLATRLPRALLPVAAAAVAVAAVPRIADLPAQRERLAYQARLADDLPRAVALAGGRERLLACGRPYVGELRGPLLAYGLAVHKRRVGFEPASGAGAIFVSRRTGEQAWTPHVPPGYAPVAAAGTWRVYASCGDRSVPS